MDEFFEVPPGDVLLHAGDFSNIGMSQDIQKFADFLTSQPHPHKVTKLLYLDPKGKFTLAIQAVNYTGSGFESGSQSTFKRWSESGSNPVYREYNLDQDPDKWSYVNGAYICLESKALTNFIYYAGSNRW